MLRALRHFGEQYSTIPVELRENEPGTGTRVLHIDPTALESASGYFESRLRLRPHGLAPNLQRREFVFYVDDLDLAETVLKMTYDGREALKLDRPMKWERLMAIAKQANEFQMSRCATEFLVNETRDYLRANEKMERKKRLDDLAFLPTMRANVTMDRKKLLDDLALLTITSMREYAERVARDIVFGVDCSRFACFERSKKCAHYPIQDVPKKLFSSVVAYGLIFFGCEKSFGALIIATTNEKRANECFEKIRKIRALNSNFRSLEFADSARAALASIPIAPSSTARARLRVHIELLVRESQKHKPLEEIGRELDEIEARARARARKRADLERLEELIMRDPDPRDPDRDREELEALEDGNSDLAAKKRKRDPED